MKNVILRYYFFLPLLLLCGFYVFQAVKFEMHDFSNYYFGGKFLAEGKFNSTFYFPYEFNAAISSLGYQNIFASYAPNTPFLAFFFLSFSIFSAATAKLVFNCISVGLFVFSIYRLFSFCKISPKFALLIPILFLVPLKNNLLFGQVYFLVFSLLAEGWLAYENERWKSMAFFWGLAILLKVFPVFLLLFLFFRKQWKPLSYLIGSCVLLLGTSLLFTGIDLWIFYLSEVLPKASNGEIATAFVPNYQSVFMFLKQILVFEVTENPQAFFNNPVMFAAVNLSFKIGVLTLGFFVSKTKKDLFFVFSYWVLAMILLSPYGSTYTFVLLILPFVALLKSEISDLKKIIFVVVLFLISNLPLSLFIRNDFPFSYLRLFLLLLLVVLLLIHFRQKINGKIVTVFSLVSLILMLIFKKNDFVKSTILIKEAPILIYDYDVKTNTGIQISFWDGKKQKMLCPPQNIQSFKLLILKNNQVFYQKKQLTFDKSNKLKPMLIDDKTIIYLSDYERGIGFYTLRTINLRK